MVYLDPKTTTEKKSNIKNVRLTAEDRSILTAFGPVAEAIASLFGEHCEVLIHSLEDLSSSIIKICNGNVTGRKIGSPMTDLGIKMFKNASFDKHDMVSNYVTRHTDGKIIKSATAMIRNGTKPIGMLCINFNLSAPLIDVVQQILYAGDEKQQSHQEHERFVMNTEDLVRHSLDVSIAQITARRDISVQEKNKQIVSELYNQGIFDVKGAVDIVANELGVSRYTIYNYIREVKI